jgi:hypothetical protein
VVTVGTRQCSPSSPHIWLQPHGTLLIERIGTKCVPKAAVGGFASPVAVLAPVFGPAWHDGLELECAATKSWTTGRRTVMGPLPGPPYDLVGVRTPMTGVQPNAVWSTTETAPAP